MKKILIILASSLLVFSFTEKKTDPKKEINVLFIGNNLTYLNDMPQILQKMLNMHEEKYKISQSTFFNTSLTQHFTNNLTQTPVGGVSIQPLKEGETSNTEKLLLSKTWDVVILQDGTLQVLTPEIKTNQVIPTIQNIQKKHKSNVSQFVLFKTWPNLEAYPKQYCDQKPTQKEKLCTPLMNSIEEECSLINENYDAVAKATDLPSVPVTNCFKDILKNHPNIGLYDGKSQPSIFAAYLNACVFFKYITKQKASEIKYSAGLDAATVKIIQDVVDKNYP